MSNTSKQPIVLLPHKTGDITLKKIDVTTEDLTGTEFLDPFTWDSSMDELPRLDLRSQFDDYSNDKLYSPMNKCTITIVFEADTTKCLEKGTDEYIAIAKATCQDSRFQIVVKDDVNTQGKNNHTITFQLTRSQFISLRGMVYFNISLMKKCDVGTIGDSPKKIGSTVYATSHGSIIALSDTDSTFILVTDDPNAPASKGMEIVWVDMSSTPNAQFALNYDGLVAADETEFKVTLELNDKSHLYTLRNALTGRKKELKEIIISQISASVTMNLLYDLCSQFKDDIESVHLKTKTPVNDSVLEFCILVLSGVGKAIEMDWNTVFDTMTTNMEEVKGIALKVQNSKEMETMLSNLISNL
jgi:hypothetical protein